ncbi:hypothetical protein O6P37_05320 [Mycobacterium sp. CPCC 205372]|uniref:Uncharacterized protein n=1 Tax=Mycobacterium hippophais TaxID=3016340 RepID=A0ABT4PNY9_9MYCO|nr:hypothetical protein [Mycobacterium hippophais]MCZ8378277.1 hypothetical protein [Mycobacterium hippophais]
MAAVRLYVADGDWQELTTGEQRAVRVAATDLQQARRARTRIRADRADVAVILDVTVAVAADYRAARVALEPAEAATTLQYAGTVDGLAGLVADIETAGVADGVTLIAASADQDVRAVGRDVLRRLAARDELRAS